MPNPAEIAEPYELSNSRTAGRVRKYPTHDLVPLLEQLAFNLRWSWHPATRDLFQALAPEPWRHTHNPIAVLKSAANEPDRLGEHAENQQRRGGDQAEYLTHERQMGRDA